MKSAQDAAMQATPCGFSRLAEKWQGQGIGGESKGFAERDVEQRLDF